MEEILSMDEIYMNDIICDVVSKDPNADIFQTYNKVVGYVNTETFNNCLRILELIRLNKYVFFEE